MNANELEEIRRIEQIGIALHEGRSDPRTGYAWSHLDQLLQERDRGAGNIRTDSPIQEISEHTVLFLRSLFQGEDGLPHWIGDGSGRTDVRKSEITIESVFARSDRELDPNKINVLVRPGPSGGMAMLQNSLKHWDFSSDAKTYTNLSSGSMQILVMHREPAIATEIAELIGKSLTAFQKEFCSRRLHSIQSITVSGYDPDQRVFNRGAQNATYVAIPVTFAYYYQWTMRVKPREHVYETARSMRGALVEADSGRTTAFSLTAEDLEDQNG